MAFLLSVFSVNSALADFEAGVEASRTGDRATAFKEIQAAAMEGDNRAYGKLASMYLYGLGTAKNYHQAYVWFQMADLAGEYEAERYHNTVLSLRTQEEFDRAVQAAENQRIELGLPDMPE